MLVFIISEVNAECMQVCYTMRRRGHFNYLWNSIHQVSLSSVLLRGLQQMEDARVSKVSVW